MTQAPDRAILKSRLIAAEYSTAVHVSFVTNRCGGHVYWDHNRPRGREETLDHIWRDFFGGERMNLNGAPGVVAKTTRALSHGHDPATSHKGAIDGTRVYYSIFDWGLTGRYVAHLNGSKGKEMKGEETRITHVDSEICIRSEVLRGVICPEVHENGSKKKKKNIRLGGR